MTPWEQFKNLTPAAPDRAVDFVKIEKDPIIMSYAARMKATPQNPLWHGEGDVWTHTKMTCSAMVEDPAFSEQSRRKQEILFCAALFHDIGKTVCTIEEDGVPKSPHHTSTGAKMARELLWTEFGLCGTKDAAEFRECVAALIKYHGLTHHLLEKEDMEISLAKAALLGKLIPDFSFDMLEILIRADIKGRITDDKEELLLNTALCFEAAKDAGIYKEAPAFPSEITQHAYLQGRNVPKDCPLYDDTWREVILLSGLPGTGKDTWINENHPDMPVISLDEIRLNLKISPTDADGQGKVLARAKELAREYLRKKQPFIWNATNITEQLRKKQLSLFEKYGAYTHIVYLETELETEISRNESREAKVPRGVIERLIGKTEPPAPWEAHRVEWLFV